MTKLKATHLKGIAVGQTDDSCANHVFAQNREEGGKEDDHVANHFQPNSQPSVKNFFRKMC